MKDEEIVEEVVHEGEESDSENEEQIPSCTVTPSQDCAALDCALEGLESEGDTDPARLMCIKKWKDVAAQRHWKTVKQTKITSYFK